MDKDILVHWCGAVSIVLGLAAAIVIGVSINQAQQVQFEQVCVNSHRNVVYAEVDGSLVSECK